MRSKYMSVMKTLRICILVAVLAFSNTLRAQVVLSMDTFFLGGLDTTSYHLGDTVSFQVSITNIGHVAFRDTIEFFYRIGTDTTVYGNANNTSGISCPLDS